MPAWPFEYLVVKTGWPQWPGVIEHAQEIEIDRRKTVLGFRVKPVNERHQSRANNWQHAATVVDADEPIGFLHAGRENAARPVKFEAAADDSHAVRQ